jgi:protein-disulfide isomerase
MIRLPVRNAALLAALLPLTLGLAACKKDDAAGTATSTAIAKVAPPAGKAWSDVIAVTAGGGYRMGNPNAPIKLVEYGSLTCSHCAEFAKESNESLGHEFVDTGRVSFEFHNFIRDPLDLTAAMLVRCAPPESFFPLSHAMFANQAAMFDKLKAAGDPATKAAMELPPEKRFVALAQVSGLEEFFSANGLPTAQAQACLTKAATATDLAKQTETAEKEKGIDSTPTLYINDAKFDPPTWPEVKARLEAMGAR